MGYLCPVCDEPFGDAQPLSNHLAVTAILHGGDHERWLAETAGDWESMPRAKLAAIVADHAEPTDHDEHAGAKLHTHAQFDDVGSDRSANVEPAVSMAGAEALDSDAQRVLSEARALTEAMQAGADRDAERSASDDEQADAEKTDGGGSDDERIVDDQSGDDERKES